jgi:hypothetical protein
MVATVGAYCRALAHEFRVSFVRAMWDPVKAITLLVVALVLAVILPDDWFGFPLSRSLWEDFLKAIVLLVIYAVGVAVYQLARAPYTLHSSQLAQIAALVQQVNAQVAPPPAAPPAPNQTVLIVADPQQLPLVLGTVLTITGQGQSPPTVISTVDGAAIGESHPDDETS